MTNTYLKDSEAKAEYDEGFKDGWNEAIEAAAIVAAKEGDYNPASYYIEAIRKLKR